ncbi:MAG: hypothetical protein H7Y00_06460 [Fimbriimonadaceae bacterium]|nr:hypothetical protein [Chitinophagales bacterium]
MKVGHTLIAVFLFTIGYSQVISEKYNSGSESTDPSIYLIERYKLDNEILWESTPTILDVTNLNIDQYNDMDIMGLRDNADVQIEKILSCMFTHSEGVVTYTVLDFSGRTIYSTKGENEIITEAIQHFNFANGIYVYTFEYEDGYIISGKFIDAK